MCYDERQLSVRDVEAAVLGGKLLGGGGGGWTEDGLAFANEAMQTNAPVLISADECRDGYGEWMDSSREAGHSSH